MLPPPPLSITATAPHLAQLVVDVPHDEGQEVGVQDPGQVVGILVTEHRQLGDLFQQLDAYPLVRVWAGGGGGGGAGVGGGGGGGGGGGVR